MARSPAGRRRTGGLPRLRRACGVAGALVAATALPLAAGTAHAARVGQARPLAPGAPDAPDAPDGLQLSVTSVSPSYATPGGTVMFAGRVRNGTRSAIGGLSVQISSSTSAFNSEFALEGFAAGFPVLERSTGAARTIRRLQPRHSAGWNIRLPVSALRVNCFGVYPLTVTLNNATGTLIASDPVPMPFWPNKPNSCPTATRPRPFPISWIWPLIDSPHQGPCPGLLDNTLAASLAPGGRLASLLAVGASYTTTAHLTWAIDPALLDNARTMSGRYLVGGSPRCAGGRPYGPDPDARKWLTSLAADTARHPVFVTPYGDVDVAGLAEYGDNTDLRQAFTNGQQLAGSLLGRQSEAAPIPAGVKQLSAVAWPAGGPASQAVLANLGAMRIGTVILAMPPTGASQLTFTPGAVTSLVDGVGTRLKVLLGDYSLSSLLASSPANSRQAGTIFDVGQLFLAETAMIVAEAPSVRRPIVVTPPRRWNPASTLAADLLGDTVTAPWLRTVPIGKLARQARETDYPASSLVRPYAMSRLSRKVFSQIAKLDNNVGLLQSLMLSKGARLRLSHALYGVESAAWAGNGAARARALLDRAEQYVASQFRGLSVGGASRLIHVTLGGRVGSVTVSIHNSLSYPVKVGLQVTSSNNTVVAKLRAGPHALYLVEAHSIAEPKLSVNATQTGKATLRLRLKAPNGVLLPNPPDKPLVLKISATSLGTVALVIFAAALAVFVAASATQAIRRGRPGAGEAEQPEGPTGPDDPDAGQSGELGAAESGQNPQSADAGLAESADPPLGLVRPDNVVTDRTELNSVGRLTADLGSLVGGFLGSSPRAGTASGSRSTEENR